MLLAVFVIVGVLRQVILLAPKNGFFYVLDRRTGEFISAEPYAAVNWASHIDPGTGRPVETEQAEYFDEPKLIFPGPQGAHNWQPMSYSPDTGLVYIPVKEAGVIWTMPEEPFVYQKGGEFPFTVRLYHPGNGVSTVHWPKPYHPSRSWGRVSPTQPFADFYAPGIRSLRPLPGSRRPQALGQAP